MPGPTPCQPIQLTDQRTLHDTLSVLRQHIPLTADGYRCHSDDLWRLLVGAAARRTTIESVCADLPMAPAANTVRSHLTAQVASQAIPDLEQRWNEALAALVPDWLRTHPQAVAVDFHDEPYYGQVDPADPANCVCRGEAQAGTTYFFRCATAYVMHHDLRLTLALVCVKPSDATVTLLDRLLSHVQQAGVRVRRLYADKGFCSIPVLRWLLEHRVPAIVAAPLRGKQGGTRALCQGRASYRTTHSFQSAEHGALRVPVTVVRTSHRRQSGQHRPAWLVYVCLDVADPPQRVRKRYRRRFGIESSYRLVEKVRARTTSRSPVLRFLLLGLAVLIVNMWIRLHWLYLRIPGRGPRRVARWRFRLDRMTHFLTRAIERHYGVVTAVNPPAP